MPEPAPAPASAPDPAAPGPAGAPGAPGERKPRKDAVRNRAAALAAADTLFAASRSPEDVTMSDIAAEAGVGKGTLFRAFGDRTGLIRALYGTRLAPLMEAVEHGPPPLGPATPPLERVPALLDALLCFKFDNRHLALALEGTGADSPYRTEHYDRWHAMLRDLLLRTPAAAGSDFTAHALLAATRADLVEHLAGEKHTSRDELRSQLADFTGRLLGTGSHPGTAPRE
ncbi:TetR/AcrR family transcriptional regulator [Kitasatospora sp. NPDC101447]|uniref:TetR/AcrR family transcriptional regulator n=1 Tax=Kitasatospora sp. NPDC101447 TaxID=3364102 RepID=UPI00382E35CF